MAKKTRKSSRKSRRRTRRRVPRRGGSSYPIIPATPAIQVSTAGENSDNLMGIQFAK
jgi:hypothetical protein